MLDSLTYAVSLMTLLLILEPSHIYWTICFEMDINMTSHAYFPTKLAPSLGQNVKGRIGIIDMVIPWQPILRSFEGHY